jgi:hypothetical protein
MSERNDTGPLVDALAGERRCTYGVNPVLCGEPAVLHVLADEWCVYACLRHVDWWVTHDHIDRHPIGGACGIPGTWWLYSTDAGPGRCEVEGLEHLADVTQAVEVVTT